MSYRIGSFNLFKFSFRSDNEIRKNIRSIANVINNNNLDIVALQEVFAPGAMDILVRELGPQRWQFSWESPRSVSSIAAEGYAFLWDKNRFRLAQSDLLDGTLRSFQPHVYRQYQVDKKAGYCRLIRDPYYGRFEPLDGSFCEIRLINTHIMFSKYSDTEHDDANFSFSDRTMRINEFDILSKYLYHYISDKRYGNNRPAYTIILGDYNLNLKSSGIIGASMDDYCIIDNHGRILKTIQNLPTTLKKKSQQGNGADCTYWSNNYDHFTIEEKLFESQGINYYVERIDSVQSECQGDYMKHRKEISDHVPVCITLSVK